MNSICCLLPTLLAFQSRHLCWVGLSVHKLQLPISMSDIPCESISIVAVMHSTCAGRQTGNHFYLFFHYFFLHCLIMPMIYRTFVKSEFCSSRPAVLRSMAFHLFEILVVSMGFPHFHFWFSKS
jgi:hypothetical protein